MKHPTHELMRLLSGDLHGSPAETVRTHLRHCSICQSEYDRLEALERRLHALPRLVPPRDFVQQVQTRIAHVPPLPARPHWRLPLLALLVGLAITALSLGDVALLVDGVALPAWSDMNGWVAWLDHLSMQLTLTLTIGMCALTVGCLLLIRSITGLIIPPATPGTTKDRIPA